MNKTELITSISCITGMPKEAAQRALNATLDVITGAISGGDPVIIPGFGTFSTKHRTARKCRNPRTGEEMEIPETNVPSFKPGKRLKEAAGR